MSVVYFKGEGTVAVNSTNVNRAADGDGQSIVLPAGLLVNTGDYVCIEAWAVPSGLSATNVTVDFGGTTLAGTGPLTTSSFALCFEATVIRTGATTQIAMGRLITSTIGGAGYTTPAETLANTITVKTTVAGVTAGSVDFRGLIIRVGRI